MCLQITKAEIKEYDMKNGNLSCDWKIYNLLIQLKFAAVVSVVLMLSKVKKSAVISSSHSFHYYEISLAFMK